ncbi:uncharacterized protein LTHEOB_3626 [Lasiodiplodia theobromae]|uniref:uncharacterized protein n=1 Tax=Lasiodiplodia theobromae TaxID=45133 RepID=UPI0015C34A2D|nr:uncharacterized protein LTHEOB_3626 [Lasiodiplodia theobromae]KAF4534013.1 hypothetical protein LTHEOB_3626 [Lasiodiplodia theobromae]
MEETPRAASDAPPVRRKHRPGLQRIQIACERCRKRKNKCDGKLPECSTCKRAGVPCVVLDRLTYREYPRGYVDDLEADVQRLKARIHELEQEANALRASARNPAERAGDSEQLTDAQPDGFAENINIVPRDVTSGRKFVGDSSGLFFGNVVQAVLTQADYKQDHGPPRESLSLRVGDRLSTTSPSVASPCVTENTFPEPELADRLQRAYFTHRWPALPVLHRPSFLEKHFAPVMASKNSADEASLFLTFMVFALGSIDLQRQEHDVSDRHLEFFNVATQNYLQGLMKADNMQTVQGLCLVTVFAINEQRSANAWHVAGQAMRFAIDLGLHRMPAKPQLDLFDVEMRKRVFWSAYSLDRNVSLALGRPFAIRDAEINVPLPEPLTDQEISSTEAPSPRPLDPLDMSTFIHIIKVRQLQSKIQDTFYTADATYIAEETADFQRTFLRTELDNWVAQAPRYSHPTLVTFQSTEWFQIAHSHALLLLYRPSPGCPEANLASLQICADAAITLIGSYSSLYAKNKITYTWIALHSLFMASITMLYTLWVSPEIRKTTSKRVAKSNVTSCLALLEVMADHWPLANRCHEIIDRLGKASVALFDSPAVNAGPTGPSLEEDNQYYGQITSDYMDWFGTRDPGMPSSLGPLGNASEQTRACNGVDLGLPFFDNLDMLPELDNLFS